MKVLFWLSAALILYAYLGYALWLAILVRLRPRPTVRKRHTPSVSIILVVRNEAMTLRRKLQNFRALTYPPERMEVIVASDGSTDETANILGEHASSVKAVVLDHSQGKAAALNAAVKLASGDLLAFFDARQTVDVNALSELAACFADTEVGAASGELHLETASGKPSGEALGIYWKLEKKIRRLESDTGSVVGVTGAIYAMRRELYVPIPAGTLLDDVYQPMMVVRAGKRVIFQPCAIARDVIFEQKGKEFSRKVRTLTGNYQLLSLCPWLLTPANPLLFRLISHKLIRLVVPLFLVADLFSSAWIAGPFYRAVFWLQIIFYGLSVLGVLLPAARRFKAISIPNTFVMLNVAAIVALYNVLAGRKKVWT